MRIEIDHSACLRTTQNLWCTEENDFQTHSTFSSHHTCPGSLYHSSSWRRSGCAFLRLISAMTSKTSESELLEQLLSSSESQSESLELSDSQRKNKVS